MKLLTAIIISISILCVSSQAKTNKPSEADQTFGKMPPPIWLDDHAMDYPYLLFRWGQYLGMKLKKDEKKLHKSAVYFMLDNAPNGKIVSWYSKKRLAGGKVRVIQSYEISGGFCRTYQSFIKVKSKSKHYTNHACKYIGNPNWLFYK